MIVDGRFDTFANFVRVQESLDNSVVGDDGEDPMGVEFTDIVLEIFSLAVMREQASQDARPSDRPTDLQHWLSIFLEDLLARQPELDHEELQGRFEEGGMDGDVLTCVFRAILRFVIENVDPDDEVL